MRYARPINKTALIAGIRRWSLYAMVASIVCSQLLINSLSILLFVTVFLAERNFREKWERIKKDRLVLAYCLYFVVELVGLFAAKDLGTGWKYTQSKLGFLALPVIFSSAGFVDQKLRNSVLMALNISVTLASLYCLGYAVRHYYATGSANVFFYHQLVSPLSHHAVYFAAFVFISFVFLLEEGNSISLLKSNKWLRSAWILYYVLLLILLSSKMVLLIVILYLAYAIFQRYWGGKSKKQGAVLAFVLAAVLVCIFSIDNPVRKRFDDMFRGNVSLIEKERYDQANYFNGLQFRLLLWRLTYEILHDKNKWLLGVGPSHTQEVLREKYRSLNMYSGNSASGDHGYFDFNAHNQFLQTTLASGIIGLAALIYLCIMLIVKAFEKRSTLLTATIFLIICFFFSESVFERQYGMILCTVFPLLLIYTKEDHAPAAVNTLS